MCITIQGQGRPNAHGSTATGAGSAGFAEALRAGRDAARHTGREGVHRRPLDPHNPITGLRVVIAHPAREKPVHCGVSRLGERLPGPVVRIAAEPLTPRLIAGPCPSVSSPTGRF